MKKQVFFTKVYGKYPSSNKTVDEIYFLILCLEVFLPIQIYTRVES